MQSLNGRNIYDILITLHIYLKPNFEVIKLFEEVFYTC